MAVLPRPPARRLRRPRPALGASLEAMAAGAARGVRSGPMDFGFTLKPDHTIERTLAITRQAEAAGFSYGWLFDSHVLWRDPYPLLTVMAEATTTLRLGHLRHESSDAGAERHGIVAGGPRRDQRRPHGPRHRAWRLRPAGARQAAHHDGPSRGGHRRHQEPGRRSVGDLRGHRAEPALGRRLDGSRSGSRATVRWPSR